MTLMATAVTTYDLKGLREDLDDVIYRISPEETPLLAMIGTEPAKATLTEWQTDALAAAVTTNAQLEGDAITSVTAVTPTVRVGNYTTISRKTFGITGTDEAVRKAGRASEKSLQAAKKGAELKLDIEASVFQGPGGASGNTTTVRTTASLLAWIKTNDTFGAGGASPTYTSGVPPTLRTDGTQAQFTETMHKATLSLMYSAGAKQKVMFMGAWVKGQFSAFAGVATKTIEASSMLKPMTIMGGADIYVGDFGRIQALPCRNVRTRDAWYIDPDYISLLKLRPMALSELPIAMDGTPYMILTEWGLKVHNEAAHGLTADLSTS